jgi:hypothetical protein
MMRHFRPKQFVEVGSDWSSACALDTADMFLNYNCAFTFIEPCPASLRDLIASSANNVEILESGIQDVNAAIFDKLGDRDFLFY